METLIFTEKMSYHEFCDLYLNGRNHSLAQNDHITGALDLDFQMIKAGTPINIEYDKYHYIKSIIYQPNNRPTESQIADWYGDFYKWPMPKYSINRMIVGFLRISIREFINKHLSSYHERNGYYYGVFQGVFKDSLKGPLKIKVTVSRDDYIIYIEYEEYLPSENWEENGYQWEDKNDSNSVEAQPW